MLSSPEMPLEKEKLTFLCLHRGADGKGDTEGLAMLPHSPSPTCACTVRLQSGGHTVPQAREPEQRLVSCHGLIRLRFGGPCLFINLIDISNEEGHKAAAYQCHGRGCHHHHDDTPSHVDQEAQAPTNQDLS